MDQIKFSILWKIPLSIQDAEKFISTRLLQEKKSIEIFYINEFLSKEQEKFIQKYNWLLPLYSKKLEGKWTIVITQSGYFYSKTNFLDLYLKLEEVNQNICEFPSIENKLGFERNFSIKSISGIKNIQKDIPSLQIDNFIFRTKFLLDQYLLPKLLNDDLLKTISKTESWYYNQNPFYITIKPIKKDFNEIYLLLKKMIENLLFAQKNKYKFLFSSLLSQFKDELYLWYPIRKKITETEKQKILTDLKKLHIHYNPFEIVKLPKVSLITPCYNGAKYLPLFLDSLSEQTYENIQLIFVDDGSTDTTKKVFKNYKEKLEKRNIEIIYIFQKNAGQAAAVSNGLKYYDGEFLMWPDSDDILYPDNIFRKVAYLMNHPDKGMVACGYENVMYDNLDYSFSINIRRPPEEKDSYFFDLLDCKNVMFTPIAFMYRTSVFKKALPSQTLYPSLGGQNYQMLLPMTYYTQSGYIMDTLGAYVIHLDSHSKCFKNRFELVKMHYKLIIETLKKIPTLTNEDKKTALYKTKERSISEFFGINRLKVFNYFVHNAGCTGCAACMNVCPVSAIKMTEDENGWLYPQVDLVKCIKCGKCLTICPSMRDKVPPLEIPKCYIMIASDKIRQESSSGGAFTFLAHQILKKGGYICGAAISHHPLEVKHIIAKNKRGLEGIRKSKYVQSNIHYIYQDVKKLLDKDKYVLFSGTPCQIVGLKSFLGKEYLKLICIDLICHGVPSQKIWKQFHKENYNGIPIKNIEFRSKKFPWGYTRYSLNGHISKHCDSFTNAFLSNYTLRDSCHTCPCSNLRRQSDITLGDFGGSRDYDPKLNVNKGISVLLIHSIKGKKLLDTIKEKTKFLQEISFSQAVNSNPNVYTPLIANFRRNNFLYDLKKNSFNTVVARYCPVFTFDVIIVNYWYVRNYGAVLTAYALQEFLHGFQLTTAHTNYIPRFQELQHKNEISNFAYKYLHLTQPISNKNDLKLLNNKADIFITGSDQVFNPIIFELNGGTYNLLNFVNDNRIKIAYSASFGENYESYFSQESYRQAVEHYFNKMNYISTREKEGVEVLRKYFPKSINEYTTSLIDPVFLLPYEFWNNLANNSKEILQKKYVSLFYYKFNYDSILKTENKEIFNFPVDGNAMSPLNFLKFIRDAQGIITDSFHACCFAIIFHKPLLVVNMNGFSKRIINLTSILKIPLTIATTEEELNYYLKYFPSPIPFSVDKKIEKERQRSIHWLEEILGKKYTNLFFKRDNSKYKN